MVALDFEKPLNCLVRLFGDGANALFDSYRFLYSHASTFFVSRTIRGAVSFEKTSGTFVPFPRKTRVQRRQSLRHGFGLM